jgi:hypothetical protein
MRKECDGEQYLQNPQHNVHDVPFTETVAAVVEILMTASSISSESTR